jgi:peptidyl-prolyl cis-trans isomerase D
VVYEQSDSLKPAAELAKTSIKQSGWLGKGMNPAAPMTPKVLQAIFSDDAIKNKRNTSAIEVAPNTLLAARVLEFKSASVHPLAEVSGNIRQKLQRLQALDRAAKEGADLLGKLQRAEKVNVSWQAAQTLSRSQHPGVDNELVHQIFQVNGKNLPAYVGSMEPQGGYVLARVDVIKEAATIDADKHNRYVQQMRQISGEELMRAYLEEVKKKATIELKQFTVEPK